MKITPSRVNEPPTSCDGEPLAGRDLGPIGTSLGFSTSTKIMGC